MARDNISGALMRVGCLGSTTTHLETTESKPETASEIGSSRPQ